MARRDDARDDMQTKRKVSDGSSSNGNKRPGTDPNTTGDTLIGSGLAMDGDGKYARHLMLPSGQAMGKGMPAGGIQLPDMTGMTSALASPVRSRVGVQHKPIEPEQVQAFHVKAAETRLGELEELASYVRGVEENLAKTRQKVEHVEDSSKDCARQMGMLRSEWTSWRKEQEAAKAQQVKQSRDADEEYCRRVIAVNEHIAQLNKDLQQYRRAMDEMRKESASFAPQRSTKSSKKEVPMWTSSSRKPVLQQEEEETDASVEEFYLLRNQVEAVAREVQRLRALVHQRGRASTNKAASSPIKPSHGGMAYRSVGVGGALPFASQKTQTHSHDVRPAVPKRTMTPPSVARDVFESEEEPEYHSDSEGEDEEEEDEEKEEDEVTAQTRQRAHHASQMLDMAHYKHDPAHCTQCGPGVKRTSRKHEHKRTQSKHHRSSSGATVDFSERDEPLLFRILESKDPAEKCAGMAALGFRRTEQQRALLARLLQEHLDEFYHHRLLYSEMADELKSFDPRMTAMHRRILADQVMKAVEGLEIRAEEINLLQSSLAELYARPQPRTRYHSEEEGRPRAPSVSSRGMGRKNKPRYSPPAVDGSDVDVEAYRRIIGM